MNTITTQTVDKLGLLADLNAAKLSGEGWTAAHSDAVGSDRFGKVIFNNGATHELVLPIGLIRKWTRLLNRGLPPYQSACNEIGVEFDKDNRLKLMAGASQITFNNRPLLASGHMPTYILNADDMGHVNWHNGEFKLAGGEVSMDELKGLRNKAATDRKLVALAKLIGKEKAALKALRTAARHQCERLAQLDRITLADAVAEAKRFRDAKRFVRKVLADPTVKPAWLLTEGKVHPPDDYWPQGYKENSESENYDYALAAYLKAKQHQESFKPRKGWSRHATDEIGRRIHATNAALLNLTRVLDSALARHLGDNTDPRLEGWRNPGDAARGWSEESYHDTRRRTRNWKSEKADLATTYLLARQRSMEKAEPVAAAA